MRLALPCLVVLSIACGGSPQQAPTQPGTPPPVLPPVLPPPAPAAVTGCGLTGPGPGDGESCPRGQAFFVSDVNNAINLVVAKHPEYFDFNDTSGNEEYYVVRPTAFVIGVIRELQDMGFCAGYDGFELQIKKTNEFHEQYHIVLSSGHIRRGFPSYRASCSPAAFPARVPPVVTPPPGCTLLPSTSQVCGFTQESASFLAEIDAAVETMRSRRPELFDGERVRDADAFGRGVAEIVNVPGRCAYYDGSEIAVKSTNSFSDQYSVVLQGNIRRTLGRFRATCYPAAF